MDYNAVGWFEIPVTDMERAKKFYENLFGVTLNPAPLEGYEMLMFPNDENKKGVPGALLKGQGYEPSASGVIIYFTCPNITEALDKVPSLGGKVILPEKYLGEWGHIAWISDSEGNTIALHRRKETQ